jgi:hypothetical protein
MASDLCPPERRVFDALAKTAKTIQEIERWGAFRGRDARARQQCVCRCLHRLIDKGLAEKTSRRRPDGQRAWDCAIYRLTRKGELWALSG